MDFHLAQLLRWNDVTHKTCLFRTGEHIGVLDNRAVYDRSPEELKDEYLNEKIDVYGLGSTLFLLLTGNNMYQEPDKHLSQMDMRKLKITGVGPRFTPIIKRSTDPTVAGFLGVVRHSISINVTSRPSAQEIVESLQDTSLH